MSRALRDHRIEKLTPTHRRGFGRFDLAGTLSNLTMYESTGAPLKIS